VSMRFKLGDKVRLIDVGPGGEGLGPVMEVIVLHADSLYTCIWNSPEGGMFKSVYHHDRLVSGPYPAPACIAPMPCPSTQHLGPFSDVRRANGEHAFRCDCCQQTVGPESPTFDVTRRAIIRLCALKLHAKAS